jgi:hypothetical protein
MARPTNRYARAQARARYRKPKRRGSGLWWNVAIGVIVLLGVGGIVVSRSSSSNGGGSPALGDHIHAQLDVFDCESGGFLSPAPEFEARADDPNIRAGIHTHGDGFMHIHPFASDETGGNATVGTFLDFAGFDISDDSWELWEGDPVQNGDACADGQPGVVRWAVNGEEQNGDPGDYKPDDGDAIVIAFLPEGQDIPAPQDLTQTQD